MEKKSRGRPVKSEIRQNIVDILFFLKKATGYEIYKVYVNVFPKCTNEVVYYHLKKGIMTEEFKLVNVKEEKGDYSWGNVAEKKYYSLGRNARPRMLKRVKEYIEKQKEKNKK